MSQSSNLEASSDGLIMGGLAAGAHDARKTLSEEFSSTFADAFKKLTAPNPDAQPDNTPNRLHSQLPSEGSSSEVQRKESTSPSLIDAAKRAAQNAIEGGSAKKNGSNSEIENGITNKLSDLIDNSITDKKIFNPSKYEVTDKDRQLAKEKLSRGLSDLIPEADRKLIKQLQHAVIDGDVEAMKKGLNQLADDPARMERFIKALNSQLNGIELSKDGKGNVLLYAKHGNTALSINPGSGETSVRAVERQADGSVLLKPGEIINRTASGIMQSLGDNVTRNLTGWYNRLDSKHEK